MPSDLEYAEKQQEPLIGHKKILKRDGADVQRGRVVSVDTFRGMVMAVMIFNSYNYWGDPQLRHIAWAGMNLADYELPAFVMLMGFSMAISFNVSEKRGVNKWSKVCKVTVRTLTLFLLNLIYNGTPNWRLSAIRIPGVLFRLGLVYFILSLVLLFVPRPKCRRAGVCRDILPLVLQWFAVLVLVTIYVGIVWFLPVPNCARPKNGFGFSVAGYIGPGGMRDGGLYPFCTGGATFYIDYLIFGQNHMQPHPPCRDDPTILCTVNFDDLGIVGILSTCLSCWIGVQAGYTYLKFAPRDGKRGSHMAVLLRWTSWALFYAIVTMLFTGGTDPTSPHGHGFMPVIKSLWTPSFVTLNAAIDLVPGFAARSSKTFARVALCVSKMTNLISKPAVII